MQSLNGFKQSKGIYMPSNDGPIQDVPSPSTACNGCAKRFLQVNGAWLHALTSTGPDSTTDNTVIDSSHKGLSMVYMKQVGNALDNSGAGPGDGWFKIGQPGYQNGCWAVDDLLLFTRRRTCAGEAHLYMECVSVRVSGGTNTTNLSTVSFPGAYKADDESILFNVWSASDGKPYPNGACAIPGPGVFTCSNSTVAKSCADMG
ncbi:hypothetical protein G6011_09451 [Alternaria panax]|uniref:AA9 family lytic polysaccharide monooxygenase n=1 Tax=Alternaria panax TaxID=48097 RepID=A0AAD4NP33_9PLEO|nr:hypothetical protein G6011_09451 [Alternaria panax]